MAGIKRAQTIATIPHAINLKNRNFVVFKLLLYFFKEYKSLIYKDNLKCVVFEISFKTFLHL